MTVAEMPINRTLNNANYNIHDLTPTCVHFTYTTYYIYYTHKANHIIVGIYPKQG